MLRIYICRYLCNLYRLTSICTVINQNFPLNFNEFKTFLQHVLETKTIQKMWRYHWRSGEHVKCTKNNTPTAPNTTSKRYTHNKTPNKQTNKKPTKSKKKDHIVLKYKTYNDYCKCLMTLWLLSEILNAMFCFSDFILFTFKFLFENYLMRIPNTMKKYKKRFLLKNQSVIYLYLLN